MKEKLDNADDEIFEMSDNQIQSSAASDIEGDSDLE